MKIPERDESRFRLAEKHSIALNQDNHGLVTLPVARVLRDGSGRFIFDASFIPPCLQISASERLLVIAKRWLIFSMKKRLLLSRGAARLPQGAPDILPKKSQVSGSHTVNESLSVLRHLCVSERGHQSSSSRDVESSRARCALFGLDSHPESLPPYNHNDLEKCFGPLNQHIRAHLQSWSCHRIAFRFRWFWRGEIFVTAMFSISAASIARAGSLRFARIREKPKLLPRARG
jgi:type VI secretion system protein ImpJ